MIDTERSSPLVKAAVAMIRAAPPLRFLGHMLTRGTALFEIRR